MRKQRAGSPIFYLSLAKQERDEQLSQELVRPDRTDAPFSIRNEM